MIDEAEIYDGIHKLTNSIDMVRKSIRGYRRAIKAEVAQQKELRSLMLSPNGYNTEALEKNVSNCDRNIKSFQEVMALEEEHIKEYERMIMVLSKKLERI